MSTKNLAKRERIVESIRLGLQGEAAVEFIHTSGYAITETGIARYIQAMGGLGRITQLIKEGKNNIEILQACASDAQGADQTQTSPGPHKPGPWPASSGQTAPLVRPEDVPLYDTAKMTVHLPADVYEAVRLAARAEGKTQNQLIVDLLTSALSRMPQGGMPPDPE